MNPHILADFTQDKNAVYGALNQLRIPGFSETNFFDALYDTLDRVDRIEGHKYVILMTTGVDTFSKLNLDQITKKIKSRTTSPFFQSALGGRFAIIAKRVAAATHMAWALRWATWTGCRATMRCTRSPG